MPQLTALISSTDAEFRSHVTKLLRSSGISIGVIDERHAGAHPPSVAIVDIRNGTAKAIESIERLRASWPSAAIFAIAATSEPDQILQSMRAGANEFLAWSHRGDAPPLEQTFPPALQRAVERVRSKEGQRAGSVLSFFGAKGGAGTT